MGLKILFAVTFGMTFLALSLFIGFHYFQPDALLLPIVITSLFYAACVVASGHTLLFFWNLFPEKVQRMVLKLDYPKQSNGLPELKKAVLWWGIAALSFAAISNYKGS